MDEEAMPACSSCGRQPGTHPCRACEATYCSRACAIADVPRHNRTCPSGTNNNEDTTAGGAADVAATEAARVRDAAYFMRELHDLTKPVLACIALSIVWVKIAAMNGPMPSRSFTTVYTESDSDSTSERISGSLQNALIIIGQIILMTVVFYLLFRYRCFKALYTILFITVVSVLGLVAFLLLYNILEAFSIPIDYITFYFGLVNFSVTGILAIFWAGPMPLQQIYLVLMSSLTAFALTSIQPWTTWILLGALALWDLFAVLSPCGPLRLLVEESRTQGRDIPGLLYTVNMAWMMAHDSSPVAKENVEMKDHRDLSHPQTPVDAPIQPDETPQPLTEPPPSNARPETTQNANDSDEEESGLKLGLGDFIFYSVLVARAAMSDWVTTIACVVAVMTGMTATIFLLAIYQKALPALPISIAFGILFYFVSSIMLLPFMETIALAGFSV